MPHLLDAIQLYCKDEDGVIMPYHARGRCTKSHNLHNRHDAPNRSMPRILKWSSCILPMHTRLHSIGLICVSYTRVRRCGGGSGGDCMQLRLSVMALAVAGHGSGFAGCGWMWLWLGWMRLDVAFAWLDMALAWLYVAGCG